MIKKKIAVIVALLMIAALSVAGCTSSINTPAANSTAALSAHNAFLEKFAVQYKNDRLGGDQGGITRHTIDITWPSGDNKTVNLDEGWLNQSGFHCGHHIIITDCGGVKNATDNFTSMTAGQDLKDDGHGFLWGVDSYKEVTGHAPKVEYMLSNESYIYLQYDQYYLGLTVQCPTPAMLQQPGITPTSTSTSTPLRSSVVPTPTLAPTPTPVPKTQCNHIDIVNYYPVNTPCSMCIVRNEDLKSFASQHTPYITVTQQGVPSSMWPGHQFISATVRETGQSYSSNSTSEVETWAIGALGCRNV
jgi:hypothetical protein